MASPQPVVTGKQALEAIILVYVSQGYRVVSRNESSAQLVRAKTFSAGWAFLWFLFCGIGLLLYVAWYLEKKDETLYLTLSPDGRVQRIFGSNLLS